MAEGARLESVYTFTGIGGSNPSLSAITFVIYHLRRGDTSTDTTSQKDFKKETSSRPGSRYGKLPHRLGRKKRSYSVIDCST